MDFASTKVKLNNIKTYDSKTNNTSSVFKKKFYSDTSINSFDTYEDIDYNSIDLEEEISKSEGAKEWYEEGLNIANTIKDYGVTFGLSLVCGALELVENVGDALIMAGGAISSGIVSIWDKEKSEEIKSNTENVVKYDWTEKLYDESVKALNVDDEIAHGVTHTIGSAIGTTAAYVAISCVPGGAAVTASVGAITAFGSASEMALNSGADFDEALVCGTVAGIAGAASGGVLDKVQGLSASSKTVGQLLKNTALGAVVSASEPIVNTTTQYLAYGKDLVDENGNKVYEGYFDYYNKSGGLLQTGIASVVGGVSTGIQGIKGYKNNKFENNLEYKNSSNLSNNIIEEVEAIPDKNLRRKIYSRMPKDLTDVEKAKYLYNKLNEELSYSTEFFYYQKDQQIQSKWRNLHVDLNDVQSKEIICTNWSEMYCELLQEQGINARIMGNKHQWCVFELKDGSKWFADATQPYNGSYDLVNAKTGVKSGGFMPITDEMFNDNNLVQGSQNAAKLRSYAQNFDTSSIDQKLGYNYTSLEELFATTNKTYDSILQINTNATNGQLLSKKLEKVIFSQMKDLDYMEGTSYFLRMKNTLSSTDISNIKTELLFDHNNNPYTTFSIDLQNGTTAEYIYGGKGKMTCDIVKNLG